MNYRGTTLPLFAAGALLAGSLLTLSLIGAFMVAGSGASPWDSVRGTMGDHMGGMMGGGRDTAVAPAVTGGTAETVQIRDFAFTPGNLRIPLGASVTWTNLDTAPHTATAIDGSWDTGSINNGDRRTLTFNKAGIFDYYCSIHPTMKARLEVR
jgi:plastocyanin